MLLNFYYTCVPNGVLLSNAESLAINSRGASCNPTRVGMNLRKPDTKNWRPRPCRNRHSSIDETGVLRRSNAISRKIAKE